jgi:DNA invertase Pin-like site-specific DNA recombinase
MKSMTSQQADAIMSSTAEKPTIHAYLRSSKVSGSHSNVKTQRDNLLNLLLSFSNDSDYTLNGEFYYDVEAYVDAAQSGTRINPSLQRLLNSLGYFDVILFSDVSRATRLDLTSSDFNFLVGELFSCDREVWVLRSGKPVRILKTDFINYAKISLSEYERLGFQSQLGNLVKSERKQRRKDISTELYNDGHQLQVIADTVGVSRQMISKYIKEERVAGNITREPYKIVIARRKSPMDKLHDPLL